MDLQNIGGTIDVENEFGDTQFAAKNSLAASPHRIVSQCGRIDVTLIPEAWNSVPPLAVTNHGGVRTNVGRNEFDEFQLIGEDKAAHVRRDWSGFRTVVENEDRFAIFNLLDRFAEVIDGQSRSNGLDLLTRCGRIVVLRK